MVGRFRRFIYRVVSGAALVFASFVVGLLALEIGLRSWDGVPVFSAINFVDRGVNAIVNPTNPLARFDDRLGWAQVTNGSVSLEGRQYYTFGEDGVRMSAGQVVPLQQGAILVVGDSFAVGSEVVDADAWPAQLEQMTGTRVINAAVGGYGFDQIVLRAEDLVPRLKPKMLLVQSNLAFGITLNRVSISSGAPKPYFVPQDGKLVLKNEPVPRGVSRSIDIGWSRSVFGYSYLVQYVMTRLNLLQWWVAPATMPTKFALSDHEAVEVSCLLMRRLGEFRDRYQMPVALVFQYGGLDGTAATLSWEKDRAFVSRCAEREHLPVVDIFRPLHAVYQDQGLAAYQQLWTMHDAGRTYGHMSAAGNKLIASLVFQTLFSPDVSEAKPQTVGP
jgi:hypothetical protein